MDANNEDDRPSLSAQLESLAWFIKRVRKERDISQAELASELGIEEDKVADIESGDVWPTMRQFIAIVQALDLRNWNPTSPVNVVHILRSERSLRRLGLLEWMLSLTDDEMTLFATRGYEAVELRRAVGVLQNKQLPDAGEPLPLLFPERLSGFRNLAQSEDD
ncbi:MAG: helix-turn-helix transcriptional regulator [Myxococcota bacterium]